MIRILVCACVLVVTSTVHAQEPVAAPQVKPTLQKELSQQELLDRIEQLEKRVRELEARLLEGPTASVAPQYGVPQGTKTQPRQWNLVPTPPRTQVRSVPEHWTPKEFNGGTYYLIPLSARNQQTKR